MKNKIEVQIPFQGFYCSVHSGLFDMAIESELEYLEADYDDCEVSYDYQAYCVSYVEAIRREYNFDYLEFKELLMPKYYNFETDRIIGYADLKELRALYDEHWKGFAPWLFERMRPKSGFIPHYSNVLYEWGVSDNWDFNQWGLLLEYYHLEVEEVEELYLIDSAYEFIEVIPNDDLEEDVSC